MKKLFLFIVIMMAAPMAWATGKIVFRWENPDSIPYRATDTLKIESDELTSFNCTFSLVDPQMSQYVALNEDRITVLNCYNQGSDDDFGKIFINATITNIVPAHADTVITGYIRTSKISPNLRWTCQLGNMVCGDSVQLSATHDNTDSLVYVTFGAEDFHSDKSTYVDVQGSTMTAMSEGRGIYATVTIGETNNFVREKILYQNNDSVVRFDVIKLDRTIKWDSTDFNSLTNLSQGIELRTTYADNQNTVVYSTSDIGIAEIVGGNYLKVNSPGRVTITAFVDGGVRYHDSQSDTIIDIPIAATTIYWEENIIESQKPKITSTVKGYNLNVLAGSNYIKGTKYHFSSSDTSVARVFGDTLLTCYRMGSFDLSVYATNDEGGQSKTITRTFDAVRGYIKFIKDGKWSDRSNWDRNDLEPSKPDFNVEMLAKCTIPNGETATCYDLNIYTQGGITVEPEGVLRVENRLENNAGEEQLIIKANHSKQGAVYFREGAPIAKVDMWMDVAAENREDTVWTYKGIPMDTSYIRNRTGKQKIYRYTEKESDNDGWMNISSMMPLLNAWQGYKITDTLATYYTFIGRLNCGQNHRYDLSYTDYKHTNVGRNMIVNSYAAPLDIRGFDFDGTKEELHYMVGRQWATAPKHTAQAAGYRGIMQPGDAMFLDADHEGASVVIDYDKAAMCEWIDNEDFNVLRVAVKGMNYSDTVALVGCQNCTEEYDNGYDGTKWMGAEKMPQIYASTEWGKAGVNADQSIVGQNIGVKAAYDGELYTISFDTKRLKDYDQLYLFDMQTQTYVDIIAGETYAFTTTITGEEGRFTIMRDKVDTKKDKNGRGFIVVGNRVLLVGFTMNEHTLVRIMNAAGVVVHQFYSDEGPWVELPELLNGVYVINAGLSYEKFYR